jgi:hypothetical protein
VEQEHISLVWVELGECAGKARPIVCDIGGVNVAHSRGRQVTEPHGRVEMSFLGSAVVPDQIHGYPVEPGPGINCLWAKRRSPFKGDGKELRRQVIGEPRTNATSEVAMDRSVMPLEDLGEALGL